MASGIWLWVMLKVMGFETGLWSAIALQALLEGLRSALVFIPAAVGVQEAGYAALAPLFGLTPEPASPSRSCAAPAMSPWRCQCCCCGMRWKRAARRARLKIEIAPAGQMGETTCSSPKRNRFIFLRG